MDLYKYISMPSNFNTQKTIQTKKKHLQTNHFFVHICEMAPQADFAIAKIGYEIEKFFGRQKSFSNNSNPPATQNLCQYKFYPTYGATTVTKVVHTNVEDLTCNEAASRFIAEKRKDQVQVKGLVGQ